MSRILYQLNYSSFSVSCLSLRYAVGGGTQVTQECLSSGNTRTHKHIYLNSEYLRTHHWEEHILPEEVLRHELSEVSKVGWKAKTHTLTIFEVQKTQNFLKTPRLKFSI